MPILGIENRTENWKTALYFSPFFTYDLSRLRLAERLGEPDSTQPGAVQIELYWHGMRDYLDQTKKAERGSNEQRYPNFAKLYGELFPDLREQIEEFRSDKLALEIKKKWNYDVSSDGAVDKLGSNLVHTEIDIVLESPKHLFIGEAKHQSGLGASGDYVLVHQLIRQYVMAKILVDLRYEGKEKPKVVPFIVGDKCRLDSIGNSGQVQFMRQHYGLKDGNILSWDAVKKLWPES